MRLRRLVTTMVNENDEKIIIKCFPRLAIYLDEGKREVKIGSKKVRELIAFLLIHKDEENSKATICQNLWKHKSIQEGMDCLYKTIRIIKHSEIPFHLSDDRDTLGICKDNLECDLFGLERLFNENNSVENKEQIISLYKNAPFTDEDFEWMCLWNAKFDFQYIQTLGELCRYYLENNNQEKAEYYRKLLGDFSK